MRKLLLTLTVALFMGSVAAQCPMCKTALKSNNGKSGKPTVGNGINSGILFLLSAPYVLIGTVGFVWYRNRIKK
jgi:hypothetical protein